MPAEVRRLANAPADQTYKLEVQSDLSEEAAQVACQIWWASKGTMAVIVMIDGRIDARYERDWMDQGRVPNGWITRKKAKGVSWQDVLAAQAGDSAEEEPQTEKIEPAHEPTLFNVEDDPNGHKPPPIGLKIAVDTNPVGQPTNKSYLCWTCKQELREYTGDTDPNPSGRLEAFRCPECGSPQPGMSRMDLQFGFMRAQGNKAITEQRAKVIVGKKPKQAVAK